MFLKSSQPPIIDKYPYTFEDLQKDYPNTSFSVDFLISDVSADEELASYNVYRVYESLEGIPFNHILINSYPVYNSRYNKFEMYYETREKTPEEIRLEKFNPVQFMKDLLANEAFNQWTELIPTKQFIILITAFNNGSFDTVQTVYNQLKLVYPLPENSVSQWQEIANNNGINLIF